MRRHFLPLFVAALIPAAASQAADPTPGAAVANASVTAGGSGTSTDWPMYRGAHHDGTSTEHILKQWPADGPRVVWKIPMGLGFSAISVAGNRAYVNGEKDGKESCYALEADTGKERWVVPIDEKSIKDRQGGDGPRSTPTIDGKYVYVLGTYMKLKCLDAETGNTVWQHDLVSEYKGKVPGWGNAASPVIDGNLIFVSGGPGNALMAFDKTSGSVVWSHGDENHTHSTPTIATIDGVRQVIFFMQPGLVSVEPATGKELWRYAFPYKTSTASSPVVVDGGIVFCSAAYGNGAGACQVTKNADGSFTAKELWRTPGKNQNHWTTPVAVGQNIYGLFKEPSELRCLDAKTGAIRWAQPKFAWQGATTYVDGCILVQDKGGDLVLVEATPDKYHELARCKPLSGKCWTMATVANGRIYARSDTEAVCLDVSVK